MLNFLPKTLIGVLTSVLLAINVLSWVSLLLFFALIKFILPFKFIRKLIDPILLTIAEIWIGCNSGWMKLTQKMNWEVQGLENLNPKGWYMVVSNHQSWVDIFVLQHIFNRKIPLLKFFLKQELIKVPVMGLAWWALDFPFMKRYTAEELRRNPKLIGKDLETTKNACAKFEIIPTSVMNFLEGTRFTEFKHKKTKSPYKHLLRPKSGGIAFAISALGEKFQAMIDITIVYPDGKPGFWDFMCGRINDVIVQVNELQIPSEMMQGDYQNDPAFRKEFQKWIGNIWTEKDQKIDQLLAR